LHQIYPEAVIRPLAVQGGIVRIADLGARCSEGPFGAYSVEKLFLI
jgi:hypothetical protein